MQENDRWERQAQRVNAKRVAEAPLFAHAGLIDQVTPDQRRTQIRRSVLRQGAKMDELHARFRAEIRQRLYLLSAFMEHESLEVLDEHRWRVYPPTTEYGADFWRGVWERLRAGESAAPVCRTIRAGTVLD